MGHGRQLDEIQDAKKAHFVKILKNVLKFIHFYLLDRSKIDNYNLLRFFSVLIRLIVIELWQKVH